MEGAPKNIASFRVGNGSPDRADRAISEIDALLADIEGSVNTPGAPIIGGGEQIASPPEGQGMEEKRSPDGMGGYV